MQRPHLKRFTLLMVALLAAGPLMADTQPEQPPQFMLESKILSSEKLLPHVASTNATGVIGDNEALRALVGKWQANHDLSVLSSPSITALANQETVLRVQSTLQYFEPSKDGHFVLKALPEEESPGVRMATTTREVTDKAQVRVDVDLRVSTLSDREKLPGVSLDVGRPLLQTRNIERHIVIPLGQWVWIGDQQLQDVASGKTEHLIVLLKVTRYTPE